MKSIQPKKHPVSLLSCCFLLTVLLFFFLPAQPEKNGSKSKVPQNLPEIETVTVTNTIAIHGKKVTYRSIFDCMPVKTDSLPTYSGRICYNAYLVDGKNGRSPRPVSFFLNGGPGAASVYLNFGVAGPRIIKPRFDQRNFVLPDGVQLVDNPRSWLDRSDLVFIDPVGTGFSYVVSENEEESKVSKEFWGVHEDIQSLSHFIRLWITDNNRWIAPKVIVGESYGGLRVGALAKYLLDNIGISPSGVVMVSPALDLWLIREQSSVSLSPWLRLLPSFIHTAQYYQKGDLSLLPSSGDLEERIESYLLEEYLPHIAQGNSVSKNSKNSEKLNFYNTLSRLTGLDEAVITKKRGLISLGDYSKNLLKKEGLVLSLYDTTVAYPDLNSQEWYYGQDTYLSTLTAAFHTAANHYYRNELGVNGLREFHSLNYDVNSSWKYHGNSKEVETFTDLEAGLHANPEMEILITHGRHDLVTPYYTSRYLILHSRIPQAEKKIRLHLYDGGHMFYLNSKSLQEFDEDISDFYQRMGETAKQSEK